MGSQEFHCYWFLQIYFCFQAHPGADQDSLVDQASIILANSTRLLNHAKLKADRIEELKLNLEKQKEKVKNVRNMLTEAAKADNDISRQLQKLDNREGKACNVSHVVEFSLNICIRPMNYMELILVICFPEFSQNLIHICCCQWASDKTQTFNVYYAYKLTWTHSNIYGLYLVYPLLCT